MLFALTDLQTKIDAQHIEAAMAWTQYATASVRYVFVSASEEVKLSQTIELSKRVLNFLQERGTATRSEITVTCFQRRVPKAKIDACLEHLLSATPPRIFVKSVPRPLGTPGTPTTTYSRA